eukprot:1917852-Rhodomonas_salina.2
MLHPCTAVNYHSDPSRVHSEKWGWRYLTKGGAAFALPSWLAVEIHPCKEQGEYRSVARVCIAAPHSELTHPDQIPLKISKRCTQARDAAVERGAARSCWFRVS